MKGHLNMGFTLILTACHLLKFSRELYKEEKARKPSKKTGGDLEAALWCTILLMGNIASTWV